MKEIHEYFGPRARMFLLILTVVGIILSFFAPAMLVRIVPITATVGEIVGIFKIVGNVLVAATMAMFLYAAIVTARLNGLSRKRTGYLLFLLLFFVFFTFMAYKIGTTYEGFAKNIASSREQSRKQLASAMQSAATIEKRSKISLLLARYAYEEEGLKKKYIGPDGREHEYQPDKEALKNRESFLFLRTFENMQRRVIIANMITWPTSMLIAVAAGIMRKPKSSNSS